MTLDVMMVIYCCSFEPPKNMADGTVVSDGLNADLCSDFVSFRYIQLGILYVSLYSTNAAFINLSQLFEGRLSLLTWISFSFSCISEQHWLR